jgi:hypothetical protein
MSKVKPLNIEVKKQPKYLTNKYKSIDNKSEDESDFKAKSHLSDDSDSRSSTVSNENETVKLEVKNY